jgi:hypothetical protein
MLRSTKAAPPSSCEFGARENEWALSPLRVRALDRVRHHAELTILAKLACALARGASQRSRPTLAAYYHRMANEPPAKRRREPRRPRHFAPYRFARFILVVLALIGAAALALLVLGLLDVQVVTDHFHIH